MDDGERMKIIYVSPLPPPEGGIATWTELVIRYLEKEGIPYRVVNNAVIGRRRKQITNQTSLLDELVRTRRIIQGLWRQIREFRPDIVHINTSCGRFGIYRDYICVLIAHICHVHVILHCHCNVQDQLRSQRAIRIFRRMAALADRVLVLNRYTHQYVQTIGKSKTELIPNFISVDSGKLKRTGIRKKISNVVYVGHVQKTKGCGEVIEAAAKLPEIAFTLVGPVDREIEELGITDNVSLVGRKNHEEVWACLEEADVFLFPSYTEGFSNALLEAMASGLPVIATDVGANRDMIEDKGGIIVPVRDVAAIISALREMEDQAARCRMSEWNLRKVGLEYEYGCVLRRLFQIYEEVV